LSLVSNPRHKAFLENYAKTFDLVGSFVAAGLRAKRPGQEKPEALALLDISEHIEYLRLLAKDREQLSASGDTVLEELSRIAFSSIVDACEWTSTGVILKLPSVIPDNKMAAIRKVATHSDAVGNRNITVEMHDKMGALKILAKHFNVDVGINDLISRIRSYGYEVIDTTIVGEDADENVD
jgi:hypothetical protein